MAESKSGKTRGFADIKTYEELDAAIRQVQRQEALNRESGKTIGLLSDSILYGGGLFGWTNILRFGIRLLRKRLLR